MKKLYKLLFIFVITSICGYVIEFIWTFATKGIFVNHSAVVIGPFNFAYFCLLKKVIKKYQWLET